MPTRCQCRRPQAASRAFPSRAQSPGAQPRPRAAQQTQVGSFSSLSLSLLSPVSIRSLSLALYLCVPASQSLVHAVPLCSVAVPPGPSRRGLAAFPASMGWTVRAGRSGQVSARSWGRRQAGRAAVPGPTGAAAEQSGAVSRHDPGQLVRPGDSRRNELPGTVTGFSKEKHTEPS